ncbi:MAG TPA: hypothetical protein VHJ20_09590 [Polyangia bacterium]|nr:hypothetical protein [Polyangia bacterium]
MAGPTTAANAHRPSPLVDAVGELTTDVSAGSNRAGEVGAGADDAGGCEGAGVAATGGDVAGSVVANAPVSAVAERNGVT